MKTKNLIQEKEKIERELKDNDKGTKGLDLFEQKKKKKKKRKN